MAVKAFASKNATVVVGAVIDPNMQDELRVTVVATGIGQDRKPEITLVKNAQKSERPLRSLLQETQGSTVRRAALQGGECRASPEPCRA